MFRAFCLAASALAIVVVWPARAGHEHAERLLKCAKVCADCQLQCDSCFKHCLSLVADRPAFPRRRPSCRRARTGHGRRSSCSAPRRPLCPAPPPAGGRRATRAPPRLRWAHPAPFPGYHPNPSARRPGPSPGPPGRGPGRRPAGPPGPPWCRPRSSVRPRQGLQGRPDLFPVVHRVGSDWPSFSGRRL